MAKRKTDTLPSPEALEGVDIRLADVDSALETMRGNFEALRALLRWFEEATESRRREFGDRCSHLLADDIGHLRAIVEPLAMDMEDYAEDARETLDSVLYRLGLEAPSSGQQDGAR
jgi:hypothetical protein